MTLFSRSLWPPHVRAPYRRLGLAFVTAPLILGAILSVIGWVLSGMSEETQDEARNAALDSAVTLTLVVVAYTWTIALGAIGVLWALSQRGVIAWALSGLAAGALGGFMLDVLAIAKGSAPLVIFSAITSAALFLTIRAIAGVRED